MRSMYCARRWFLLWAALLLPAQACDDGASATGDGGTDTDTDTDVDTDTDADTDSDSDAGPDGGELVCAADPERILGDVAYYASEELGGRETGMPGNEAALADAEAQFAEIGLEAVGDDGTYRQAFGYSKNDYLAAPSFALDGESLDGCTDYAVLFGSGSGNVTEEIVYVGYGMTVPPFDPGDYPDCPLPATGYDDYGGVDVNGKVALVVRHGPDDDATVPATCPDNGLCGGAECLWNFSYKTANAELHGADAIILVQHYGAGPGPMHAAAGDYVDDFAAVWADRDAIEAAIPDLEEWTDGIDAALLPDPHGTGVDAAIDVAAVASTEPVANLLGAIPGTDPELGDEVVIVGGHIDHLGADVCSYLGADDNASGSAVILELARLMAECANPARTIVFALWNGEEEGLLGSIHYVGHPTYPLDATVAAFSVDMVGDGNGTGLALYGATLTANAWLQDVMVGSAAEMGLDFDVAAMPQSGASDHAPFAAAGLPAVMATTLGSHPYYHTPADTIDTIDLENLEASASLMYAGLKPLVEGTEQLYLTSGKALRKDVPPDRIGYDESRHFKNR